MQPRGNPIQVSTTVRWLGGAGLLPFLAGPVLITLDATHRHIYLEALSIYALCITCFLAGSWWGIALIRRYVGVLLLSNLLVVTAVIGWVVLGAQAVLPWLAFLLLSIFLIERRHPMFAAQPAYYLKLRSTLTVLAAAALCVAWVFS